MRYYDEDRHKLKDRQIAALVVAGYLFILAVAVFFVKIGTNDISKEIQPNLILMDFGDTYTPTPKIATNERQRDAKISDPEDVIGKEDSSIDKGLIASDKKVDSLQSSPPQQVNTKALYSRSTSVSKSTSESNIISTAIEGGSPEGAKNSTGTDIKGSFSLEGRTLSGQLVSPPFGKNTEGRIVIEIRVNRDGDVTSATYSPRNSTISEEQKIKEAIVAAKKTRFSGNNSALFVQAGTITYNYRLDY